MQTTLNFGLKKIELSDSPPDITVSNSNWDEVDKHLFHTAKFQKATGTATAIALSDVNLTDGFVVQFIASADNNGASTTINGKSVYKEGTTVPPKLKTGKAVIAWYDATKTCFFVKASAAGGTAVAGDVLAGKTFSNDDDIEIKGTIPVLIPSTYDQRLADEVLVGNFSNDGVNHAYFGIPKNSYTGDVGHIKVPAPNLIASNIAKGKDILGVVGTLDAMNAIRGITRDYYVYAGQNISAGDFVKYVTGVSGVGAGAAQYRNITPYLSNGYYAFVAEVIDDTHLLLCYCGISYLTNVIITINGVEFTIGTAVTTTVPSSIFNSSAGYNGLFTYKTKLVILSPSKAVLIYPYNGNGNLTTIVINMSGTAITSLGAPQQQSFSCDTVEYVVPINLTQFIVVAQYASAYYLSISACTVSGDTVTFSTINFSYGYNGSPAISWGHVVVSSNKTRLYVLYNGGSSTYVKLAVYKLTGANITSISGETTYQSSYGATFYANDLIALSNTQLLGVGSSSGLNGKNVFSFAVSDTGITAIWSTQVSIDSSLAGKKLIKISDTKALLIENHQISSMGGSGRILRVINSTGTTTPSPQTAVDSVYTDYGIANASRLITGAKSIMFALGYDGTAWKLQAQIVNTPANAVEFLNYLYETQVALSTNNNDIQGVALDVAVGGTVAGANASHNQATRVISKV